MEHRKTTQHSKITETITIATNPEEYSKLLLIGANIAIATWIILAAIACGFLRPLLTWLYLVTALVLVFGVLRKTGCNSCYNCKTCTMGFGKIADLFFGNGAMTGVKTSATLKLIFAYILLGIIPTACILASAAQEPVTIPKLAVQTALLALLLYSSTRKPPQNENTKNTTQNQTPKRKYEKRYLAVKSSLVLRCHT